MTDAKTYADDEPYIDEIVAPIESVTRDATLREIRGDDLPADRSTLKGLSDALDAVLDPLPRQVRQQAMLSAILFS